MSNLTTVQIKAFVPSKDFELAKRFYVDLGFSIAWSDAEVACMQQGVTAFLLQNYYVKEFAESLMMHMLVENVDDWWQLVIDKQLDTKYAGTAIKVHTPPMSAEAFAAAKSMPWAVRDFVLTDPTGVLWRIAEVTP